MILDIPRWAWSAQQCQSSVPLPFWISSITCGYFQMASFSSKFSWECRKCEAGQRQLMQFVLNVLKRQLKVCLYKLAETNHDCFTDCSSFQSCLSSQVLVLTSSDCAWLTQAPAKHCRTRIKRLDIAGAVPVEEFHLHILWFPRSILQDAKLEKIESRPALGMSNQLKVYIEDPHVYDQHWKPVTATAAGGK